MCATVLGREARVRINIELVVMVVKDCSEWCVGEGAEGVGRVGEEEDDEEACKNWRKQKEVWGRELTNGVDDEN